MGGYGDEGAIGVHESILNEQDDLVGKDHKRFLLYDVPKGADLEYEVELISVYKYQKQRYEMLKPEMIAAALERKRKGAEFFKEQGFEEAAKEYMGAVYYLCDEEVAWPVELDVQQFQTRVLCELNSAQCFLKTQDYSKVLECLAQPLLSLYERIQAKLKASAKKQAAKLKAKKKTNRR